MSPDDEVDDALLETPPEPWGTHQTLRYVVRYPGNGHSVAVLCFTCRSPWPCDGILSQIEAHHYGHRPALTGSLE